MSTRNEERGRDLVHRSAYPTVFDPFMRLRGEMDDLFGRYFRATPTNGSDGDMLVALDVTESEKAFEFTLDVPGVKREDIDIDYEQGRLTVSGERRHEETEEKKAYRRSERAYGAFSTSFVLPTDVDGEKIRAELKEGVLTVMVPKSESVRKQAKKIAVKGG